MLYIAFSFRWCLLFYYALWIYYLLSNSYSLITLIQYLIPPFYGYPYSFEWIFNGFSKFYYMIGSIIFLSIWVLNVISYSLHKRVDRVLINFLRASSGSNKELSCSRQRCGNEQRLNKEFKGSSSGYLI